MPKRVISLASQAFGEAADNALIVAYHSHQDAQHFLASALGQPNGIALLSGPSGAGKSTLVKEQSAWSSRDAAVALVDGSNQSPRQFLQSVLAQFGVAPVPLHDEQMLQAANNFASQQKRAGQAPIIIVDNVDRATTSTMRLLNWLAALDVQGGYALRFVFTGKERLENLFRDASMRSVARRNPATFAMNPLSERETMLYLRTRLMAAGGERPEKVFPLDLCSRLHEESLGWPGQLNRLAFELLQEIELATPAKPIPRVIITRDGATIAEHELAGKTVCHRAWRPCRHPGRRFLCQQDSRDAESVFKCTGIT